MKLKNISFKKGNLSGITLNMNPEYVDCIFDDGNTDQEMMSSIAHESPIGKTILDVGAFIGSSSLVFAKYVGEKGKVISFEPNPYNLKKIEKNLSLNSKLSAIIKVYDIALADEETEMKMVLSDQVDTGPSSTSRLYYSHSTIRNEDLPPSFKESVVSVTTLDLFVKKHNLTPDIIKVDIEGAEDKFLLGAKKTLSTFKPTLYIEIHSEFCALKCYEVLSSLGYEIFILREEKDNRVMVKAIFSGKIRKKSLEEKENLAMQGIENSIRIVHRLDNLNEEIMKSKDCIIEQYSEKFSIVKNQLEEKLTEIAKLQNELQIKNAEIETKDKQILDLHKIAQNYENSKSWKITKPLRLFMKKIKK